MRRHLSTDLHDEGEGVKGSERSWVRTDQKWILYGDCDFGESTQMITGGVTVQETYKRTRTEYSERPP